jgi:hypothetical protein
MLQHYERFRATSVAAVATDDERIFRGQAFGAGR